MMTAACLVPGPALILWCRVVGAGAWNAMSGACRSASLQSPHMSCPRRRASTRTRPIPVPEEMAWWVAVTGTAMTCVGWGAVLVLRSRSAPYRAAGARHGKRAVRHSGSQPIPNTSFPRRRETTRTRPIPVPEEMARWVAATGAAMTCVGWGAVLVLRSRSALHRAAGARHGKRAVCHSGSQPIPNTSFPCRRETTRTRPIPVPEEMAWWVAVTGTAMTWVGLGAVLVLRSRSAPYRAAGARHGNRKTRYFAARPSPNTLFPRRRETARTRPIPVPEEMAWWVAVTGTAMTCVGWGAVLGLRSRSALHRAAGARHGNRNTCHFCCPTIPQHVIPAHAGTHPDAANHGPGRGGLVGRRDRHGDDVCGVGRGACIAFAERAGRVGL